MDNAIKIIKIIRSIDLEIDYKIKQYSKCYEIKRDECDTVNRILPDSRVQ